MCELLGLALWCAVEASQELLNRVPRKSWIGIVESEGKLQQPQRHNIFNFSIWYDLYDYTHYYFEAKF